MIALFALLLRLSCICDIRRKMQIYGAHVKKNTPQPRSPDLLPSVGEPCVVCPGQA